MENKSTASKVLRHSRRHTNKKRNRLRATDARPGGGKVEQAASSAEYFQRRTMKRRKMNGAKSRDHDDSIVVSANRTKNEGPCGGISGPQNDANQLVLGDHENLEMETANESISGALDTPREAASAQVIGAAVTEEPGRSSNSESKPMSLLSGIPRIEDGGQERSVDVARIRLDWFTRDLASLNPRAKGVVSAKTRVYKAEVDYNYCLYYPVNSRWRPPPLSIPENLRKTKSLTKPKLWAKALWLLVEKSMKDGTLRQVQDGTLVVAEIPRHLCEFMVHDYKGDQEEEQSDDQDVRMSISPDRSGETSSRSAEEMMINVDDAAERHVPVNGDISDQNYQSERPILHLHQEEERNGHENRDNFEEKHSHGRGAGSGSEEGEVAEEATESEAVDTMHDYSNCHRLSNQSIGLQENNTIFMDGPSEVRGRGQALKDLTPELLHKQLRYFHIGKHSDEIDLNLLAKCLACGGTGHDPSNCATIKCSNCGTYNKHLAILCPTKQKCSKCRENGHSESSCPYKLKQLSLDEINCDLCRLLGHVESDCELVWRTSGKTSAQSIVNQVQVLLSCYECGTQGHLGNDCPTRRPGKSLGSSSWTMYQRFDAPLQSDGKPPQTQRPMRQRPIKKGKAQEMKIKGLAKNRESLADREAFLRPKKQSEQPMRIIMHINPGAASSLNNAAPPASQSTSTNQPFGSYGVMQNAVTPGYQHAHHSSSSREEAAFVQYNHGNPTYDGSQYEGRRDRSRSPQQGYSNREYRGDRNQPNPPPPTANHRSNDMYRPMPSAARDAFRRHRV